MKTLMVDGTRPQFIKATSVASVLSGVSNPAEVIVNIDQHYDKVISDVCFEEHLTKLSCQVVLPLPPHTKKKLNDNKIRVPSNMTITKPVNYLNMVHLEQGAQVIATDSGSQQEEAFFNGVPCLTLLDETEWTELVTIGTNRLAGANADSIHELIETAIGGAVPQVNLYGTGNASKLIATLFERLV